MLNCFPIKLPVPERFSKWFRFVSSTDRFLKFIDKFKGFYDRSNHDSAELIDIKRAEEFNIVLLNA